MRDENADEMKEHRGQTSLIDLFVRNARSISASYLWKNAYLVKDDVENWMKSSLFRIKNTGRSDQDAQV